MPGTTVGTSLNVGYPGSYSRNGDCVISARLVKSDDTNNINFGDAVFLNGDSTGGTYSGATQVGSGITLAAFAGIAVREVKSFETFLPAPTLGAYAPGSPCDVLHRGTVIVPYHAFASNPAPVAGGGVFIRKATNGAGTAVGQFESAADGGNTVDLGAVMKFTTGVVDANGNVEVTILTRNLP